MARGGCILRRVCAVVMLGAIGCDATGSVGAAVNVDDGATSTSSDDAIVGTNDDASSSSTDAPPSDDANRDPNDVSSAGESSDSGASSDSGESSDDATTSSSAGTEEATTGASGFDASCCAASTAPGCDDAVVVACVCASDSYCCEVAWDDACVAQASADACDNACEDPQSLVPPDCCLAQDEGNAGCSDTPTQDCVCAYDPYCCLQTWDDVCVGYVDDYACGSCT